MGRVGRGREPWERSEAGGVNDNERHLRHSPVSSPRRSFGRNKEEVTTLEDERGTGPGLLVCVLCVAVVREGLPRFICVCLFY